MANKRSYHQYCGLAVALDLLGERWTLLILRDLMMGPKRFTDLLDGLPGIGTGLLGQRLRDLESAGVIERATLPPPAASAIYRLTADGQALRAPLLGLARWGLGRLGAPAPDQRVDVEWVALAITARFVPETAEKAVGSYGLVIDGRPFQLDVGADDVQIRTGEAHRPRAALTASSDTLIALNNGTRLLTDTLADGSLVVDGELDAVAPLAAAFGL